MVPVWMVAVLLFAGMRCISSEEESDDYVTLGCFSHGEIESVISASLYLGRVSFQDCYLESVNESLTTFGTKLDPEDGTLTCYLFQSSFGGHVSVSIDNCLGGGSYYLVYEIVTTTTTFTTSSTATTSYLAATMSATMSATTASTSLSATMHSLTAWIRWVESQESAVLAEILSSNESMTKLEVGSLSIVAMKLDTSSPDASLTVPAEGMGTEVRVPTSALAGLVDGAVLMVTSIDLAATSIGNGGDPLVELRAATNINLFTHTGSKLSLSDLVEPIEFTLPTNRTVGLQCAYWDEANSVWATEGLELTEGEFADGSVVCATTHLTFFAAIVRGFVNALRCSQVSLLTSSAVAQMLKDKWYLLPGACAVWVLLSCFLLWFAVAMVLDWRRWRQQQWTDEDFLIALNECPEGSAEPAEAEEVTGDGDRGKEPRSCAACMMRLLGTCACGVVAWCRESSVVRDALDEVLSTWITHFAEVRDFIEGCFGGLEVELCGNTCAGRCSRVSMMTHRIMERMLALSARRQASASLGISDDAALFLLEDERAMDLVLAHQTRKKIQHSCAEAAENAISGENSSTSNTSGDKAISTPGSSTALQSTSEKAISAPRNSAALQLVSSEGTKSEDHIGHLHEAAGVQLERHLMRSAHWRSLPGSVVRLFLWQSPVGGCAVRCFFQTSTMRVLLFMVEIVGSLMLGTVFFQASGTARNRSSWSADCKSASAVEQIGRLFAIGSGSFLVAVFPSLVLSSLSTRTIKEFDYKGCPEWNRQLRVWHVQDVLMWTFGLSYSGFCVFFMSIFHANVAADDQVSWVISGLISVVEGLIVIPFCVALFITLLGAVCLSTVSKWRKVGKHDLIKERHLKMQQQHPNLILPRVFI